MSPSPTILKSREAGKELGLRPYPKLITIWMETKTIFLKRFPWITLKISHIWKSLA